MHWVVNAQCGTKLVPAWTLHQYARPPTSWAAWSRAGRQTQSLTSVPTSISRDRRGANPRGRQGTHKLADLPATTRGAEEGRAGQRAAVIEATGAPRANTQPDSAPQEMSMTPARSNASSPRQPPDRRRKLTEYASVFELLGSALLSAQATDVGVNRATRRLFVVASTRERSSRVGQDGLEARIRYHRLYRSKARHLMETCACCSTACRRQVPHLTRGAGGLGRR